MIMKSCIGSKNLSIQEDDLVALMIARVFFLQTSIIALPALNPS